MRQIFLVKGGDLLAKTLYVGNLPWQTTEDELRAAFESCGAVLSARIITERETGRSRGFGFVEVEDGDADKCIQEMNGKEFGGRALTVNEAKTRERVPKPVMSA